MINNCINKAILQIVLVGGILAQTGQEPFADEKSEKVYYIQSILEAPLIDGILDDSLWSSISPITDFIQKNPYNMAEPSEYTEVYLAYDAQFLYVAAMW